MNDLASIDDEHAIASTRRWLERAVVGLGLCPFAAPVHRLGLIHYAVSRARDEESLIDDLAREALALQAVTPDLRETTLLIHPWVLADFVSYNAFLARADRCLADLGLEGELQIASFHPQYQFADAREDAVENNTNRSPFPMLHLLREASVERAIETFPDTDSIYLRNIETLRRLGHEGWRRLFDDEPGTS
jgi:hypothetical protein